MLNYAIASIENHLFFARIMREHALFLQAGFPCKNKEQIQTADFFHEQFEILLRDVTELACGRINPCIIQSGELVTEFTIPAEQKTSFLTGIPIDSRISEQQLSLQPGFVRTDLRELNSAVIALNERALTLLNDFIDFKETILNDVNKGELFTSNYPLLIEHILREAKKYRSILDDLTHGRRISALRLCETECFWNQIMMEHALFIRGLLDPSEEELIATANDFAGDYKKLLEQARHQDCRAAALASLSETKKYRDFKISGTEGILDNKISSIILPLLADHVLREANHYIRLLSCRTPVR